MAPIKIESITLKKCNLFQNCLLIAIDIGSTLTKIIFLNKKDQAQFLNQEENYITIEFSLFRNADFDKALERIKLNACLLEDDIYKIHVTGNFTCNNKDKIKSVLNKDVVYVDKLISKKVGLKIVLEHVGIEKLMMKEADVKGDIMIESKTINKLIKSWQNKIKTESSKESVLYPCLFHVHGSVSRYIYFDENQNSEVFGLISEGGKGFLGLAKCVLDTNNYNEIMSLAALGNISNVDTTGEDILNPNSDSPYGKFPPDMSLFPFGKCDEFNKGKEDLRKEDLALALISMYIYDLIFSSIAVCLTKKVSKLYLVGNIFISDIFQQELKRRKGRYSNVADLIILNCGYSGPLGAMVINKKESRKN